MKVGIIGAGQIGGTLTRLLRDLGHDVWVANSRGPETLTDLAHETGATPATARQAACHGQVVIITIQQGRIPELPKDLFDGVAEDIIVVDTGNYYPQQRDGRIDGVEEGLPESRWVEQQLGRPVVKAFNNIYWKHLLEKGKPRGTKGRIALPVAGDDAKSKAAVLALVEDLGFDAVDAGPLDESWRQQPDTPVYGTDLGVKGVRLALAKAVPERKAEWRATKKSPGNFERPA